MTLQDIIVKRKITDVQDLGDVMINQLTDLFVSANKKTFINFDFGY